MADTTYTPAILGITLTPNPASVGQTVTISVSVIDVASTPREEIWYAGEINAGEV